MTIFLNTENSLDQLDRELRDLTREHGHVFDLDPFRRHLDTDERPTRESTPGSVRPSRSSRWALIQVCDGAVLASATEPALARR